MARGVNKVILLGNLGRDPETRYSQGGNAVTKFGVATSEQWRDRQTGEQQERTEWHNIVCFGRLAEIAGEYLRKGSKVYIEGKLSTSSWEDQQTGQKRYRTEIIASEMQMLETPGGRQRHPANQQPPSQGYDRKREPNLPDDDDFDDDIPFAWIVTLLPAAGLVGEVLHGVQGVL